MPVHSREKKESNHEEMEVDFPEQDGSSTDEEDTVSTSVSEDGDSSEMDDEDCERRRMECLDEMTTLEKQFTDLKEQLYKERLSQVDVKLQEVMAGCAQEYLEPLANLQENMQIRTKVAGIYKELCLESVKNKYDCEIQAACQHWESEKLLLFDTVQSELEEKIRRLEEDRHSIDITSELWNDGLHSRKNKKKDPFCPIKKKKPVVVSGPYIVYMLQDLDILEDWTAIRKPKQNDTTMLHGLKMDGFSMTASGTAGARPSVSTGKMSFPPVPSSPPSTMMRCGSNDWTAPSPSCTSPSCRKANTPSNTRENTRTANRPEISTRVLLCCCIRP
ncbi:breast cancer metastasis-suppressor 1-like protein-A isoform X1 [Phyllopteryx taeniolatus]|uniref:breast cancer metastasis-suppressor 1-like protein-A isoform X1 n=1 Tax=Phyllopteryx taeniolatus TaxID=161469 RepID=UPI002AD416E1|nr:breast cancer metastasis-suppressor 1-like protein-A isoform X1 [Phyllopteryx taeniolatus]